MAGKYDDVRGSGDSEADARREAKRVAFIADLSERLRPICRHLTDAEFSELVADMAETKLRFAMIETGWWPKRDAPAATDSPDRPIDPAGEVSP